MNRAIEREWEYMPWDTYTLLVLLLVNEWYWDVDGIQLMSIVSFLTPHFSLFYSFFFESEIFITNLFHLSLLFLFHSTLTPLSPLFTAHSINENEDWKRRHKTWFSWEKNWLEQLNWMVIKYESSLREQWSEQKTERTGGRHRESCAVRAINFMLFSSSSLKSHSHRFSTLSIMILKTDNESEWLAFIWIFNESQGAPSRYSFPLFKANRAALRQLNQ